MIEGVHAILYSPRAAEVREFLRDVAGLGFADPSPDWPIFALPSSELAVHPTDGVPRVELYLLARDLHATLAALRAKGVEIAREPQEQRWGVVAALRLPDGSELPIYQPKHASVLDAAGA